jgi:hypothetical protein
MFNVKLKIVKLIFFVKTEERTNYNKVSVSIYSMQQVNNGNSYLNLLINKVQSKPSANMIGQTENLMGVSSLRVMNE